MLKSFGQCSDNAIEYLPNIGEFNNKSPTSIKEPMLPLINDKISLLDTTTYISVATQTMGVNTVDTFTQTCFNTITSTPNLSTLKVSIGNIVTDEDIKRYLTRKKKQKEKLRILTIATTQTTAAMA